MARVRFQRQGLCTIVLWGWSIGPRLDSGVCGTAHRATGNRSDMKGSVNLEVGVIRHGRPVLTHYGWHFTDNIFRWSLLKETKNFQLNFSWKKKFVFWLKFHGGKSYGSVWQWDIIGSGNGLAPEQMPNRYLNQWWPFTGTYIRHQPHWVYMIAATMVDLT